jgi:hypothetical protein
MQQHVQASQSHTCCGFAPGHDNKEGCLVASSTVFVDEQSHSNSIAVAAQPQGCTWRLPKLPCCACCVGLQHNKPKRKKSKTKTKTKKEAVLHALAVKSNILHIAVRFTSLQVGRL